MHGVEDGLGRVEASKLPITEIRNSHLPQQPDLISLHTQLGLQNSVKK